MKKTALWKDNLREIWNTKNRFISVFTLILLGVAFFAGLKATGPDMIKTANSYYQKYNLADNVVQSTRGIDESDIQSLKKVPEIKAIEPVFIADLLIKKGNRPLKVYSYDTEKKQPVNNYRVKNGRLPLKNNEIALDDTELMRKKYQIGETINLIDQESEIPANILKNFKYRVVGFISSPSYIKKVNKGRSQANSSQSIGIAIIPKSNFKSSFYTAVNVTFKNTANKEAYSKGYEEMAAQNKKAMESALKDQPAIRLSKLKKISQEQIASAEAMLYQSKAKLSQNESQLTQFKNKIEEKKSIYQNKKREFEQIIERSAAKLKSNEQKLNAQKQKINLASTDLANNQEKIIKADEKLKMTRKQIERVEKELNSKKQLLEEAKKRSRLAKQTSNSFLHEAPASAFALDENVKEQSKKTSLNSIPHKSLGDQKQLANTEIINLEKKYQQNSNKKSLRDLEKEYQQALAEFTVKKEQQKQAEKTLAPKKLLLNQKKLELSAAKAQYEKTFANLNDAKNKWKENKQSSETKFTETLNQLNEAEKIYNRNKSKFNREKRNTDAKLALAESKLLTSKKEMVGLKKPQYYIFDRTNNPGYSEYKENADRLTSLSTIFPVFFFLIAALVSLTTMTRMIEERRTQIGTLKALGYGNLDIMKKFLLYGFLAGIGGFIIGLILGFTFFPTVIFNAYRSMYNLSSISLYFYTSDSIIALFIALFCTTIVSYIVCRAELMISAANLMRPRAPKKGKRILLERLPFIWKRMNFINKVAVRNVFRYKQRMLMTILGVSGCTALLLTGFGLHDSISDIEKLQYGKVFRYNVLITKEKNSSTTSKMEYEKRLQDKNITDRLKVSLASGELQRNGKSPNTVSVVVPENSSALSNFINLRNRKGKKNIALTKTGAVVSEKLAKLYHLKPGDTLSLKIHGKKKRAKVTGIAENYVGHYLYMTKSYYKQAFQKEINYNADLLKLKNKSPTWEKQYEEKLTKNPHVLNVSYLSQAGQVLGKTLDSLNIVIVILIVSAALLAFIVLYNLTNINVSERIRELSTIKVLGFYPKEVTMYVYRENMFLTFIGILTGFIFGYFLHRYVITTAEMDDMMFSPTIRSISYFYSTVMTFIFATLVMVAMHIRLKRVDMVEALKSVE